MVRLRRPDAVDVRLQRVHVPYAADVRMLVDPLQFCVADALLALKVGHVLLRLVAEVRAVAARAALLVFRTENGLRVIPASRAAPRELKRAAIRITARVSNRRVND
jgi:hypothetical protein